MRTSRAFGPGAYCRFMLAGDQPHAGLRKAIQMPNPLFIAAFCRNDEWTAQVFCGSPCNELLGLSWLAAHALTLLSDTSDGQLKSQLRHRIDDLEKAAMRYGCSESPDVVDDDTADALDAAFERWFLVPQGT
jgi:hypothetical protein